MSVPQSSTVFNHLYFDALDTRVQATVTCDGLQKIATQAVNSVNATISAVTSQLSLVQADFDQLAERIATLESHIATMTGSHVAFAAVATQAATATAVVDLSTVIAYLHAQGTIMVTLGTAGTASFIAQALKLAQELIEVQTAYTRLEHQIESFTTLLTDLPARLESLTTAIASKAATIPLCEIT